MLVLLGKQEMLPTASICLLVVVAFVSWAAAACFCLLVLVFAK